MSGEDYRRIRFTFGNGLRVSVSTERPGSGWDLWSADQNPPHGVGQEPDRSTASTFDAAIKWVVGSFALAQTERSYAPLTIGVLEPSRSSWTSPVPGLDSEAVLASDLVDAVGYVVGRMCSKWPESAGLTEREGKA